MAVEPDKPPFFEAVARFTWFVNRGYRVYVRPGELVFIYAGTGGDAVAEMLHRGPLGFLYPGGLAPSMIDAERRERLACVDLSDLVDDHKYNFRLTTEDLRDLTLDPYSLWLAVQHYPSLYPGVLRIRHVTRGKVRLCISTVNDMKKAVEQLPAALGDRVTINVRWDDRKKRFVRKK